MGRVDRFDRADFSVRRGERDSQLKPSDDIVGIIDLDPTPARPLVDNARRGVLLRDGDSNRVVLVDTGSAAGSQVATPPAQSEQPIWPIAGLTAADVGDTIMPNRRGRPHKGIDLHAESGTPVLASRSGVVVRVVDGRNSKRDRLRRAGLFVDVKGADGLFYRYLHLGAANVGVNLQVSQGQQIGTVSAPLKSGLGKRPHLHFEIRKSDYANETEDYGPALNPLRVLPKITDTA